MIRRRTGTRLLLPPVRRERPASGIWRQVPAANPGQHDERDREQLLTLHAAELGYARRSEGRSATAEDVQGIALRECGLLIDITQARVLRCANAVTVAASGG